MTLQKSVCGSFSGRSLHRTVCRLLLWFFLAGSAAGWAATIRGTVEGPRGARLAEAKVTLFQEGREVVSYITDQQGGFFFDRLNPGTYHLQAVLAPYLPSIQEIVLGEEERQVVVHLGALNESVSITASRSPARPSPASSVNPIRSKSKL